MAPVSHRVRLLETGAEFEVEAGETVLNAALRADIGLAHDCQLGGCGTCRVRLIEGAVTYEEWPFALTQEEAAAGYALMCQAQPTADLVIQPAGAGQEFPDPQRHTAVIKSVRALGPRVSHLVLDLPLAGPLLYRPGQYMDIVMPDGGRHSFSMASAPRDGLVDFHIRRLPGGRFTEHGLARAQPGDTLEVELPHGSFHLRAEDDRPLLMVATGTGLAPLKAMLEPLMDNPDCPPVSLYWGTRTPEDLYWHDEIQSWGERLYDFRYVPVLSRAEEDWRGRRGYVQDAVMADHDDLSEYAIYLCGSPAMIADAKRAFLTRAASIDHIYSEGFTQQAKAAAAE